MSDSYSNTVTKERFISLIKSDYNCAFFIAFGIDDSIRIIEAYGGEFVPLETVLYEFNIDLSPLKSELGVQFYGVLVIPDKDILNLTPDTLRIITCSAKFIYDRVKLIEVNTNLTPETLSLITCSAEFLYGSVKLIEVNK